MKQLLEEIIKEWWNWQLPVVKPRQIDVVKFFDKRVKKAISIVGFRRVGKTFLLFDFAKKIGQENCVYINFEDERIPPKTEILTQLIEVIKEIRGERELILLMDEIQNIPNWSKWVRRINDTQNYFLVISGSSSKLSSVEIPTELRGRTITLEVSPLSFKEFVNFKEKNFSILPKVEKLCLLRKYLIFGGLPEIVLSDETRKHLLLDEYYQTFLLRDIFERYQPRQKAAIKDMIRILLNCSYLTIGKLSNNLRSLNYKIGKSTVANYLSYLQDSFFIRLLEIHTPSVKSRLQHPKKIYFIDNFFLSRFSTTYSQNLGKLMENLVAQALFKKTSVKPTEEIYYWKDYYQREVDFVLMEDFKVKELIQVTYASSIQEISEREIKSLIKAGSELRCPKLTIITWDYRGEIRTKEDKIKCIPLWLWLA
jgi:predicted AAA+ superfamily ATPase